MQFEKIRTINKSKIIIGGMISLGVISALIYFPSRAKYRTTESFNIVNGTINYRVPDLNVVAMYTVDESNVETSIEEIPIDDSNYTYTVNTSKSACTVGGETISSTIELENGSLTFKGITEKGTKCSIYFDKVKVPEVISSGDIIAGNPSEAPSNKFENIADTDEGVFKVKDPMYGTSAYSYYYRGAVTNNYVKFANFCWRIIRINGDGSVRLIYDGESCHANGTSTIESVAVTNQKYNSSNDKSYYVGYTWTNAQRTLAGTVSNLKTQTDNWYNEHLADYDNQIAAGKFCNDRNTQSGYSWSATPSSTFYYAARGRLESAKTPTLDCNTGDVYTLKVGAITADEISFAGGKWQTENKKYYLYNGQGYWTMSPYSWNDGSSNISGARMFFMDSAYGLYYYHSPWATPGVRPVINLRADTIFSSGDGTLNSPFTVQ